MAEAFGRVAAEAMAASRPVGSTRVGGVPEVVEDGFNGLLVPADDAGALAEAVVRLRRDHDLAAALAANGRARVHARFDASRDLAAWTSVIAAVAPAYRDRATSIRAAAADDRGERLEEDRHVLSE